MVEQKVIEKQKEVKEFRAAHGDTKVGEVTVNMVHHNYSLICVNPHRHVDVRRNAGNQRFGHRDFGT